MTSPYLTQPLRTPGQAAYEADLAACPRYHDGELRPAWADLTPLTQWTWERNPVARFKEAANG
jgi:hypothetical protein